VGVRFADLLDGTLHEFEPGEDFIWPIDQVVVDFEEGEEETDEELGPYESPVLVPIVETKEMNDGTAKWSERMREKHRMGMGWSSLAIAISTLIHMVGGARQLYQNTQPAEKMDRFVLHYAPDPEGWPGGRL
jgi:hypothetical protein